jgi:hypothetical protein
MEENPHYGIQSGRGHWGVENVIENSLESSLTMVVTMQYHVHTPLNGYKLKFTCTIHWESAIDNQVGVNFKTLLLVILVHNKHP